MEPGLSGIRSDLTGLPRSANPLAGHWWLLLVRQHGLSLAQLDYGPPELFELDWEFSLVVIKGAARI